MAAKRATKKPKNTVAKNLDIPAEAQEASAPAVDSVLELALAGLDSGPKQEAPAEPEITEQEAPAEPEITEQEAPVRQVSARASAFIKALLAQYGPGISGASFEEIVDALSRDKQVVVTKDRVVEVVDQPAFATYDRKSDVRGGDVLINVGRALVHAKHF